MIKKKYFSYVITKTRRFPCKVDTKGVINEKRFFKKKKNFTQMITENRPFPSKVEIKKIMSKK